MESADLKQAVICREIRTDKNKQKKIQKYENAYQKKKKNQKHKDMLEYPRVGDDTANEAEIGYNLLSHPCVGCVN